MADNCYTAPECHNIFNLSNSLTVAESRSAAPKRPTSALRQQCADFSALLQTCQCLAIFYVKSSSRNSLVHTSSRPHRPKVLRGQILNVLTYKSSFRVSPIDSLPRSTPDPAETETLHLRPLEPHYPKKREVFELNFL
jgi:hypothetical protein